MILKVGDMVRRNSGIAKLSFVAPPFGVIGIVTEVAESGNVCKVYWNATKEIKPCISRYLERVS